MTKLIGYEWRLREQMAAAGMFSTTKLIPLLAERGVNLSSSQVYRLVTDTPERLNLVVLAALMDILGCTADDLIVKVNLGRARTAETAVGGESASTTIREQGWRPRPARITD
ncbi:helix-turn-helix domain-containing protein [Microbacterium sp. DT81.1]|uniref:helix-turn-helix domain-containing protein n=1 Tax=Microbacterium sp. DT81.1 TaxID=3393413 RepID=UPI003CF03405